MTWRETSPMEERIRFVKNCRSGLYEMSELCDRYGISRKTGYKWLHRFEAEGAEGLVDRSRAPLHCEHRMADAVARGAARGAASAPDLGTEEALGVARGAKAEGRLAGGE